MYWVGVLAEYISSNLTRTCYIWGPFYQHGLPLFPVWMCNHIHFKVWDEITYPFLNFNGCTVEV